VEQVTNVLAGEVSVKTCFHVLNFLGSEGIVVVEGRIINKLLVKDSFEEEFEVTHEAGVVAVLILLEN
jgi:hypothetical protein